MGKIYLMGLIVLLVAILLNFLASKLQLVGWYDFLTKWVNQGRIIFRQLSWKDYLWLFILYPFLLGLTCKWGMKLIG
jgi:hypothetical protein